MSFDAEQFARYKIANAPVQRYPFAHFFIENVFPPDYYRELIENLPAQDTYTPIDETGTVKKGSYKDRHICELEDVVEKEVAAGREGGFWEGLESWLMDDAFTNLIVGKFRPAIEERFGAGVQMSLTTDCRLVRDFTNYAISPHTDTERKLISLLFYLPRDDSKSHLGTSIYAPEDPKFRSDGTMHYHAKGFKHVARMDYVPNALFAFLRTDHSFHGVEPIADAEVERNLMLYNVYVPKVIVPRKPASKFRWPWQVR
jgi:hypothetical protein